MRIKVGLGAAAAVALLVLVASSCAVRITDFGGPYSYASDISETGIVVGSSTTSTAAPVNPVYRPFKRLPDGTLLDLGTLPGHTSGAAVLINESGVIAGISYNQPRELDPPCPSTNGPRAVIWSPAGVISEIGVLAGGCSSEPRAMNEHGVIVGYSNSSVQLRRRAFVYDPTVGHIVALPELAGAYDSSADAINDHGIAVGRVWLPSGVRTVQWDLAAGTVVDITATSGLGRVTDIDEAGVLSGSTVSNAANGFTSEAAIWSPGQVGPTLLGAGNGSVAAGPNDHGVVVGTGYDPAPPVEPGPGPVFPPSPTPYAFRWEASTGLVRLAPGQPSGVAAVNDAGQMVGTVESHAAFFYVS